MLATSRQNQFHFKWNAIGELFRNLLVGKKYWRWIHQGQEMRNLKISLMLKDTLSFLSSKPWRNLSNALSIWSINMMAKSQWHLDKEPKFSLLDPPQKFEKFSSEGARITDQTDSLIHAQWEWGTEKTC